MAICIQKRYEVMYIKVHVISGTRISLPCLLPFLTPCSLAVGYPCGQFQILERPVSDAIMQCSVEDRL
jgi:hypothetical protein